MSLTGRLLGTRAKRAANPVTSGAGGGMVQPFARPNRSLPAGYQYKGHCGRQQQLRNLRHSFRKVCALRDPASIRALARLHESLFEDPDPGFATLHLAHVALTAATDCGTTWAESMDTMLDKFEERASA